MNPKSYAGKTILFFVPHADDLHYQAGGTAALLTRHGARVISIVITDGARGTRLPGADLDWMKMKGEQEARRAAGITGLSEVIFLGYPDAFLHSVPYLKLREEFIALIRRYRPQVVVTWDPFNPREPNPDHRHAAPAVYDAAGFADYPLFHPEQFQAGISPWPVAEIWLLSNFPEALDQYVDITPVIEVKVQALLAYEKDMHLAVDDLRRPLEAMDPGSPLIPKLQQKHYREIMAAFVRERARALGERCGFQFAEGFRTIQLGFPYDFKGFHQWLEKWIPES